MKIKQIFLSLLCSVCLVLSLSAAESEKKKEIVLRLATGEWSPYQSQNLKKHGVATHIIMEAFALSGIKVKLGYFPWARSFEFAKKGKWDGTFLWFDTPERRNDFYISDPVVDIQYVFFYLKSDPFDWKKIEDLQGLYIGGTIKYDYGEAFQTAEKNKVIKVERSPSDEQNFKKLLQRRIRIFPNDLDAGFELIRKHFSPEQIDLFTYHSLPLRSAPHHLLLSKKVSRNKEMIRLFNQGIQKLRKKGTIDMYLEESRQGKYKLKEKQ